MKNIKVLVVDDDPVIVELICRVLHKDPVFDTDSALNGYDALRQAGRKIYDVLVCDIDLPDIDGTELVSEMRSKRVCPGMVVYVSGAVKSAPRNMLSNTFFVRKPFNPSELIPILLTNAGRS